MRVLYCAECFCKVAEIAEGSRIKKGMVVLCMDCETRRKALELKEKTKGKGTFADIFDNVFKNPAR